MWSIGTDTGGTFTDLVALSDAGEIRVTKIPSTPPNFERGVVNALRDSQIVPTDIRLLYHGTTVTTNAILTRTGAPTALVTTRGFRDILEIRRANRQDLYDILWDPPSPLIPRYNRIEIAERLNYRGEILLPLDEEDVRRAARICRKRGIESVAICFIHSYANASHEVLAEKILASELPGVYLCASSEVIPEPREFERTSTVVANAYVGPVLERYLAQLENAVRRHGYSGDVLMMHSGGGTMTPENALKVPVRTAASGPAAGAIAAVAIANAIGRRNVVSLDMGGTSTDIATIHDGKPRRTIYQELEWGMPILFPSIDLIAIGAGGGSIAWIDQGGAPRSGPHSAGALPGPACYGRGGTEPTTTDAQVVLGRLTARSFLGGRFDINEDLAWRAIRDRVSEPLRLSEVDAAAGIIEIANGNMINALRRVTIERGFDPREFSLLAFGGAGPMHAVALARELEMPEVIVPSTPGATSALGLLFVDARHDFTRSYIVPQEQIDCRKMERMFREMEEEAVRALHREGFTEDRLSLERLVDLRYVGQVRAIPVTLPAKEITPAIVEDALRRFHEEYEREFKYANPDLTVETKSVRVAATGITEKPTFRRDHRESTLKEAFKGRRDVYFREASGFIETPLYERASLAPGCSFAGPAIVQQFDSTTVIPPGATAEVDEYSNLLIKTAS